MAMCTHLSDKEFRGFALGLLDWLKLQRNNCTSGLAAGAPAKAMKGASEDEKGFAAGACSSQAQGSHLASTEATPACQWGLLTATTFDLTALTSMQLSTLKGYYTKLLFLMSFCCQLLVTDGTSSSLKDKKGDSRRFRRKSAIGLGMLCMLDQKHLVIAKGFSPLLVFNIHRTICNACCTVWFDIGLFVFAS
jgi:hypothetical protein